MSVAQYTVITAEVDLCPVHSNGDRMLPMTIGMKAEEEQMPDRGTES